MSIKKLVINFQLIISIVILLASCASNVTQKKVSSQHLGTNYPKKDIKNSPEKISDSKKENSKKMSQKEKNINSDDSFEEYVKALLKNNKSKVFPDINSIPN